MEQPLFLRKPKPEIYKLISLILGTILIILVGGGIYSWQKGWLKIELPEKEKIAEEKIELKEGAIGLIVEKLFSELKNEILLKFKDKEPKEWGERVSGVKAQVETDKKVLSLTFDASGGLGGNEYDADLINYLKENNLPATLFLSGLWIDANLETTKELAQNPLFEIENLGLKHRPCSVNGKSAYGIEGTKNVGEVVEEIELNAQKIKEITDKRPKFYRSGTAFLDEVCVEIANELGGYEVVGFSVLGDAGATYSKNEVKNTLLQAPAGSIVILHMNQPQGQTAEGLREALPELKNRGFEFVKLSEFPLK